MMKWMQSSLRKPFNHLTLWTLMIPAVLLFSLGSVAYGLGDVIPQLNFWLLFSLSITSVFSTWIMATTKVQARIAVLISLLFAIPIVLIRAGGLEGQLMITLRLISGSITHTLSQSLDRAINPISSWTSVQIPLQDLIRNIGTLLDRSGDWVAALLTGKPVFDPVVTILAWGLVMWTVSFWAAWMVRRDKNPLLGLLPAGSLLAIALSYTLANTATLLAMLGATLLLVGLVQQSSLEKGWRVKDISLPLDFRTTSLALATTLSLSLVLLAALTPSITFQDIVEIGRRWTSAQSEDTQGYAESLGLSSKPRRERTAIDNMRMSGLPQEHLLGSGPELSEEIVFRVRTLSGPSLGALPTYYWRSITYDKYSGNGWLTSGTTSELFEAGQPVITSKLSFQQSLNQEVEILGQVGHLLFYAGSLVSVDQDFILSQRSTQDIFGASVDTGSYLVDSFLPIFNENVLRETGTDYPEWIQRRYLALPEDLPQRVRDLAQQLTATVQTPYDRALIIESYLREFPYSLDVPAASRHRDIADYFLFDLQRGFCGYYATSMSVLARAAGLPARLVIGYASNNYDPASQSYVITQAEAHAWVEVYFEEFGWVEFEPTPNRPPIPRLQEPSTAGPSSQKNLISLPDLLSLDSIPINLTFQKLWIGMLKILGVFLLSSVIGIISWIMIDTWRIRLMSPVLALDILYLRFKSYAHHLEVPYRPGDTPYEFFSRFTQHIDREYRQGPPLTDFFQSVGTLVNFYVQANYTPDPPSSKEAKSMIASWGKIHLQLIRFWLYKRVENIIKRRRQRPKKDTSYQN